MELHDLATQSLTGQVAKLLRGARLAHTIYAERNFERMPELADALETVACKNEDILAHCRSEGPHVRGCWAVDLILGKS